MHRVTINEIFVSVSQVLKKISWCQVAKLLNSMVLKDSVKTHMHGSAQ